MERGSTTAYDWRVSLPGILLRVEGAALLAVIGVIGQARLAVAIAPIWLAPIGMDRALGFGPKYPTGFKETHLGRV